MIGYDQFEPGEVSRCLRERGLTYASASRLWNIGTATLVKANRGEHVSRKTHALLQALLWPPDPQGKIP